MGGGRNNTVNMAKIFYETPNKGLSYATLTVQIIAVIIAIGALLCTTPLFTVDPSVRKIVWWVAFGFAALGFILEYISNTKKVGSSRIIASSFLVGVTAIVLLIISTILKFIL